MSREDIVRHIDFDPEGVEEVVARPSRPIVIVDASPAWPAMFDEVEAAVRSALGSDALAIEHVGSTSVPDLPAKPIIDIDVTLVDPTDEAAYRPPLESAGFVLVHRERAWHEHRLFVSTAPLPDAHVHVFGPDSPELVRHRLLRDWLIAHPDDRAAYAAIKRAAAARTNAGGGTGMAYNQVKEPFLRDLLDRVFRAHGLL
jgi:GrpB-like predicted nucleotidyltransferase (UPF0157 family)